jgi:predicted 3-demethylubiquinone-9 3-methyltransferase (glyoxalase superfamily)
VPRDRAGVRRALRRTAVCLRFDGRAEVDRFREALSAGGEAGRCGMLRDPESARADRVMAALMQMGKLDLARLTRAYEES